MSHFAPTVARRPLPERRVRWTASWIALVLLAALLPSLVASVLSHDWPWLLLAGASVVTALCWNLLFALVRRRPLGLGWLTPPLLFAILLPGDLPLWQAVLAMSFGIVSGELIFGGRNWSFLNSAVVSLGFLLFSFPATLLPTLDWLIAAAVVPGALILLIANVISWRVPVAAALGCGALAWLAGLDPLAVVLSGSFVFGAVFLAADPVAAATTNLGRLLHGLMFGALVVLFFSAAAGPLAHAVVFAALLSSVLAPLLDQVVIMINVLHRRRRYGRH